MAAPSGVNFPKDASGARPTTALNQGAFEASIRAVSANMADDVAKTKSWRFGYQKHVVKQVEAACEKPQNALKIATAGLDYLHNTMMFESATGETSLAAAMKANNSKTFETGFIQGTKAKSQGKVTVPYVPFGTEHSGPKPILSGASLQEQVETWVRKGVIEVDTGRSILSVMENEGEWCDLSDQWFVLFGAGSAMGPYPLLMALGANVIALDLDRPGIWERLISIAKDSPGTLTIPLKQSVSPNDYPSQAGCNLLSQPAEIRNWLMKVAPGKQLICGAYAYLDGPLFVRVSMAMDAIIKDLMTMRPGPKIGLAYLCTPTDAHVVPPTAMTAAKKNYQGATMWMKLFEMMGPMFGPRKLAKNARQPVQTEDGREINVVDAIVGEQGPNYILAKRLQHWRAVLAKEAGHLVSTNIAPSTATISVTSNKQMALAYKGMHHFKPMEVFEQDTTNALMAALLINDVRNPSSVSQPGVKVGNPMELFQYNSFHGGAWRLGYKFGSIGLWSIFGYCSKAFVVNTYLAMYNMAQFLGWFMVLMNVWTWFAGNGFSAATPQGGQTLWKAVGPSVTKWQYLMCLECFHALFGMVRAGFGATALQIFSRVAVVAILNIQDVGEGGSNLFPLSMLLAWSITESIRYPFLTINMLPSKFVKFLPFGPLKWCRYSFFTLLYPMGVAGEMGCLALATDAVLAYKKRNLLLQFMRYVLEIGGYNLIVLAYLLGLPFLYGHMLAQRAKVLGGGKKKDRSLAKKNA